ncbi:hypothetical protein WJX72_006488 [[Myrmecia] bisecta]|uniref:Uncharacterized protein n=1 Tax=[Myrmecia] bisecta TaxID=41462 RepID=A0AAW1R727_9CHLO
MSRTPISQGNLAQAQSQIAGSPDTASACPVASKGTHPAEKFSSEQAAAATAASSPLQAEEPAKQGPAASVATTQHCIPQLDTKLEATESAETTDPLDACHTAVAYAEAVLAGLPPSDEAVQMAKLASSAGNTLEEVMQFNYAASSSREATGHTRLEGSDELGDSYQDVSSWCDPQEFAQFLKERQERKDRGLPPRDWKRLKKRRLAVKEKIKRQQLL